MNGDGEADDGLIEALGRSQRLGFLGDRPLDQVIEHARGFVRALDGISGAVVDLGAGGGVPGLVVAHDRPDLRVTLVDRRTKRTDFLRQVVRRWNAVDRIEVVPADVADLIADGATYDAAIARGFGPPDVTLRSAASLVGVGGRIVISEPPSNPGAPSPVTTSRWPDELLRSVAVVRVPSEPVVAVFQVADQG